MEFRDEIREKSLIKEIIEFSEGVKDTVSKHLDGLDEWWNEVRPDIEEFYGDNYLWDFRDIAISKLKEKMLPIGVLGEFKIAGIFVNWWEDLRYDFKTIVSTGWSKNLIDDEIIKNRFFAEEMEEIEEFESKIAEIGGELNEILDEVEDWDEEEQKIKTANKVKKYLEEQIRDILLIPSSEKWNRRYVPMQTKFDASPLSELAKKTIKELWDLHERVDDKNKELNEWKKKLKTKKQELGRVCHSLNRHLNVNISYSDHI